MDSKDERCRAAVRDLETRVSQLEDLVKRTLLPPEVVTSDEEATLRSIYLRNLTDSKF